jgi:hypothetical protein
MSFCLSIPCDLPSKCTNKLWTGKERKIQKAMDTSTTGFGSCILILERYTES